MTKVQTVPGHCVVDSPYCDQCLTRENLFSVWGRTDSPVSTEKILCILTMPILLEKKDLIFFLIDNVLQGKVGTLVFHKRQFVS